MTSQPVPLTQVQAVEKTLLRISNHKGVLGLLVISPKDGYVWKTCLPSSSPFDEKKLVIHAEKLHAFISLTRSIVRTLDVHNELLFLRLRSRKHEFIVSPEKGVFYYFILSVGVSWSSLEVMK